jgi:UDP-GlcNAc:undecaprenyl-phosphate GlcNAc-1-phosphate transferase
MSTYILAFILSFALAVILAPAAIRLAGRFNVVDFPDVRKVHRWPVPRAGGVVIMVATVVPVCLVAAGSYGEIDRAAAAVLGGAAGMFLVGLVDDLKRLRARFKLLCQLLAALAVCTLGVRITSLTIPGLFALELSWFSWPLSILWLVGITNAVNLSDGLDGLAAGLCAICCAVITAASFYFHEPAIAAITLPVLGALLGFLLFNFNPARMFMGDCGSLFVGFTIAAASALLAARTNSFVSLALTAVALGIPVLDTAVSIIRRFLGRRSVFAPDRSHFHHRLLTLGLNQRQAVLSIYVLTAAASSLGMFMLLTKGIQTVVVPACLLLLFILLFRLVGSVRLRELVRGLRHKHVVWCQARQEVESFEQAELYFRQALTFDQWWRSLCVAAEHMYFASLAMSVHNRDGRTRHLSWHNQHNQTSPNELIEMSVPLHDRRAGPGLRLTAVVHSNGSLESAGRRMTLFSRLLDEHGVRNLGTQTSQAHQQTLSPGLPAWESRGNSIVSLAER